MALISKAFFITLKRIRWTSRLCLLVFSLGCLLIKLMCRRINCGLQATGDCSLCLCLLCLVSLLRRILILSFPCRCVLFLSTQVARTGICCWFGKQLPRGKGDIILLRKALIASIGQASV